MSSFTTGFWIPPFLDIYPYLKSGGTINSIEKSEANEPAWKHIFEPGLITNLISLLLGCFLVSKRYHYYVHLVA
jgi:hypothetical protein